MTPSDKTPTMDEKILARVVKAHTKAQQLVAEAEVHFGVRDEAMQRLVDAGAKPKAIASVLGITPEKVGQALRRLRATQVTDARVSA